MGKLALADVVRPYLFLGVDLGPAVQELLEFLHVDEYDTAIDDNGVAIWGIARIDQSSSGSPTFSPFAGNQPNSGADSDAAIAFDWHDPSITFRLTTARQPAASLDPTQLSDAAVQAALGALGPGTGTAATDFPNTQFRLDLLFNLVTLTFPSLIGAKPAGAFLAPDPENPTVKIDLPRILVRIDQDSGADTDIDVDLGTWGAETLDDADEAITSLVRMRPTYALTDGGTFGFGIEKAVIDFSATRTPPDLVERFGIGDDFKGIHLPEVRIFFSTERTTGTAGNVGARDLVIGLAPEAAVWGDLNFDLDFRGEAIAVGLRLYSVAGERLVPSGMEAVTGDPADSERYQISVPSTAGPETENYLLYVDVTAGAAPFTITAVTGLDRPTEPDDHGTFPDDAFFDTHADAEDLSALSRTRLFSHDQRIAIRITSRNPAQRRTLLLDVIPDREAAPAASTAGSGSAPDAHLEVTTPAPAGVSVRIVDDTDPSRVVVAIDPPDGTVTGFPVTDGRATIPLAAGASQDIEVTWTVPAEGRLGRLVGYFRFDEPGRNETVASATVSATPIGPASPSPLDLAKFRQAYKERAAGGTAPRVRVDAYASFEAGANQAHNAALSQRRAHALTDLLVAAVPGLSAADVDVAAWGEDGHATDEGAGPDPRLVRGQTPDNQSALSASHHPASYEPAAFRTAVASFIGPTTGTSVLTGVLQRDEAEQPDRAPAPAPPASQQPDWLRSIGATIRWEREFIPIAGELRMTVDFQTAHEEGLEQFRNDVEDVRPGLEAPNEGRLPTAGSTPNPDDGVVEFRVAITYDPSTGTFSEVLVARAGEGDRDGLWSWGEIPAADATGEPDTDPWRDLLGLYFTLAPLTAATAADTAAGGEVVPLVVSLVTPVVVTGLGVAHVMRITHHGIELATSHNDDEFHAALLFDIETALWLNLKLGDGDDAFEIVTTRPDKPIKVRYKAVGFQLDVQPDQPTRFLPVFDSSRGYTIDLADSGSLRVLPALGDAIGDIIQVLGARIARTNPLNIEVQLGLGVDLGVFSVDAFGFRLPIDPLGAPSITAIGIGVDIPNTLVGKGYLEILDTGFVGQLDLTLPSVGLRIAAGVRIQTVTEGDRSATGVLVTLAVEFPGGIPLGGTGMAIFGFLGLFAMHHKRLENPSARQPALDWMVNRVAGDPTRVSGWGPALDAWAFGVGLVAGTIEGGTVLNVKGMLLLELPGPRVLLLVKAALLSAKPPTRGTESGTLTAVIDISPQRVLIGIQIHYEIEAILELDIPVEAGFFFDPPDFPPEHFYVDIGTIRAPVKATILELFEATAYFMAHGDGIPDFPLVAGGLQGFSLATGFSVSIVWGNTDIGLYLKAAGGFDAGIGFAPFFFAGKVYFDGALHLFIISIEVHAELAMLSNGEDTLFTGEICGKVSFFFFSVKGCVDFRLGVDPAAPHAPDPIRDLTLQSRSPALVEGTATDRGVDTTLCHGTEDGSVPVVDLGDAGTAQARVPIDAIPLIQFEVAPLLAATAVDGTLSGSVPPGEGGWQKRGPNFLRYTVTEVELRLVSLGGAPPPAGAAPTLPGPRPYTWRRPAQVGGSDGMPADLAVLDWKPTNVDRAMLEGDALDAMVEDRFDHVCTPVAEPASVLWTFRQELPGPDEDGWDLDGEAWPDAPGTIRTQPVDTRLLVTETWRTGTFLDGLLPHKAAEVIGGLVPCPTTQRPPFDLGSIRANLPVIATQATMHNPSTPPSPTTVDPRRGPVSELLLPNVTVARDSLPDVTVARDRLPGSRLPEINRPGAAQPGRPPAVDPTRPPVLDPTRRPDVAHGPGFDPPVADPTADVADGPMFQPGAISRAANRLCPAMVLEAPSEVLADELPAVLADTPIGKAIRELDRKRNAGLRDVVRLSGGPHRTLTLLIVARSKMVESGMFRVLARTADGATINDVTVDFTPVSTDADVPTRWFAAAGPWDDDVKLARGVTSVLTTGSSMREYIVRIKLPEPAWQVDVGIQELDIGFDRFGLRAPSWLLAVVEGLSEREVQRHDDDEQTSADDAASLGEAVLHTPHALLHPNARYDVVVHYSAEIGRKPLDPDEDQDPNEIIELQPPVSTTTTRTFFTDDEAPRNLEPWHLVSFPAPDEPHHFHDDPVVLVFATNDIHELYGAYGLKLQAVARAASFRGSAGTPEAPFLTLSLLPLFEPVGTLVPTPWEATVRRTLGTRACVDLDPDANGHGRTVLPFPLDPVTDYIVDLEAVDDGGTVVAPSPLPGEVGGRPRQRQRLTTSRYANREALAADVAASRQVSVRVPDPTPLIGLEDVVSDDVFDRTLVSAGLEVRPRPRLPEISRLWSPDDTAVPVAIYLETPEPLWRTRLEPEPVYAEDGVHILQWRLARRTWLEVDELVTTTSDPVSIGGAFIRPRFGTMTTVAPTVGELRHDFLFPFGFGPGPSLPPATKVTRFVRDASGTRTLALLAPSTRGTTVTLGLPRVLHPLLDVDVTDTAALLCEVDFAPPAWEAP